VDQSPVTPPPVTPPPVTISPVLTVLIDDVRSFRDGRPALVARTSADGVDLLTSLAQTRIEDLWLDHDLTGQDSIAPVIAYLVDRASAGRPLDVGTIHIHASRAGPAHEMGVTLRAAGYHARHSYHAYMWRHRP